MLTIEQTKLAESNDQHILCLASAGSGKTYTLTLKVAYLIQQKHVKPEEIIIFSFSRTATVEMRERLKKLLGSEIYSNLKITTFHAYCYHIIDKYKGQLGLNNFNLVNIEYFLNCLDQSAKFKGQKENTSYKVSYTMKQASSKAYQDYRWFGSKIPQEQSSEIYGWKEEIFKDTMDYFKKTRTIVFNDLIILVSRLFRQHPEILKEYQSQFTYMILDEAQDTQELVFDVLDVLVDKQNHHFMSVGDIQQTLYGFNGASPKELINFSKSLGAKIYNLSETFRFGPSIAKLADKVVGQMELEDQYKIHTRTNQTSDAINYVNLNKVEDDIDQENAIVGVYDEIHRLKEQGVKYSDIFVIGRTNKPLMLQANYCQKLGVPVIIKTGSLLKRKEIIFCMALIDTIYNFNSKDFLRVAKEFNYGVDTKTIGTAMRDFKGNSYEEFKKYLNDNVIKGIGAKRLEGFNMLFDNINESKKAIQTDKKISSMFKACGGQDFTWMIEEGNKADNRMEMVELLDNIYDENKKEPKSFTKMLQLQFSIDNTKETNAVSFMTIHASKGRSLPYVIFDSSKLFTRDKMTQEDIEAEKYCLYVAITRTKTQLNFLYRENTICEGLINDEETLDITKTMASKSEEPKTKEDPITTIIKNKILRQALSSELKNYNILPDPIKLNKTTEKAICLTFNRNQVWFPKNSIKQLNGKLYALKWIYKKNKNSL